MKRYPGSLTTVFLTGILALAMSATVGAQQSGTAPEQYPQQQGAPQQGQSDAVVGRVSFLHGDVSTQHSNSSDWAAATLNTPIVNGDHISAGNNSRAEIQLDHANILRLSDGSMANVVNLSRSQIQLQVG